MIRIALLAGTAAALMIGGCGGSGDGPSVHDGADASAGSAGSAGAGGTGSTGGTTQTGGSGGSGGTGGTGGTAQSGGTGGTSQSGGTGGTGGTGGAGGTGGTGGTGDSVHLSWDRLFDANYAYNIVKKSGGEVPCKDTGGATSDVYDGTCTQPNGQNVPLSDVATFRFYTSLDCWDQANPDCNIGLIEVPYAGQANIYAHQSPPSSCPGLAKVSRAYRRHTVVPYLADPDIFNDDCRLLLAGTTAPNTTSKIYASTTAMHNSFSLLKTFDPSAKDPDFKYCWIWGTTIDRVGGMYVVLFSAQRVAKSAANPNPACPTPAEPVGYMAFARDASLDFGKPKEIGFPEGAKAPHSWAVSNQQLAVRIDNSLYYDDVGKQYWMPYVWFNWINGPGDPHSGNWISSVAMNDPTAVVDHTWPEAGDGHVSEGGEFLRRGAEYFLFFSVNPWQGPYGMKYLRNSSLSSLRRTSSGGDPALALYRAVNDPAAPNGGYQVDAAGAPAILEVDGETYLYYHILRHVNGACGDPDTNSGVCRRDTVVSRIDFDANNHPYRLNGVNLTWPARPNQPAPRYSLDVQLMDNTWIGPCIHNGILGSSTTYRYDGVCSDLKVYPKGEIKTFRVFEATDGTWGNGNDAFVDVSYDGSSNNVVFGSW